MLLQVNPHIFPFSGIRAHGEAGKPVSLAAAVAAAVAAAAAAAVASAVAAITSTAAGAAAAVAVAILSPGLPSNSSECCRV